MLFDFLEKNLLVLSYIKSDKKSCCYLLIIYTEKGSLKEKTDNFYRAHYLLRYDLGGIWTSPRTRSRDVLALLISGRSIDKTNKHGGMSNISGTISESQICSIKLGEMDLIFSSHIPEVKASVN